MRGERRSFCCTGDNPDFVDVVVHSYRHRYGLVPGDPAVASTEERLTGQPLIGVPTVAMDGDGDGVMDIGGCTALVALLRKSGSRSACPVLLVK